MCVILAVASRRRVVKVNPTSLFGSDKVLQDRMRELLEAGTLCCPEFLCQHLCRTASVEAQARRPLTLPPLVGSGTGHLGGQGIPLIAL